MAKNNKTTAEKSFEPITALSDHFSHSESTVIGEDRRRCTKDLVSLNFFK